VPLGGKRLDTQALGEASKHCRMNSAKPGLASRL
jgi:hypothetical protein